MALSPTSSHGGGTFNGGTITQPLVIDLTGGADNVEGFKMLLPDTFDFSVKPFEFRGGGFPFLEFTTAGNVSTGGNGLTTGGGTVNAGAGGITTTGSFSAGATAGVPAAAIAATPGLSLRKHAAPADGDLVAGEVALWYDQTNGAAKLMLKGKTADGTVVTASVALA